MESTLRMLGLAPAAAWGSGSASGSASASASGSGVPQVSSHAAVMVVAESTSVLRLLGYNQLSNEEQNVCTDIFEDWNLEQARLHRDHNSDWSDREDEKMNVLNGLATTRFHRRSSVPNYKTWSRSYTTAEIADMGAQRSKIEGERVNNTENSLKTYPANFRALEELSETMQINTQNVCFEYIDFMNEERRRIMQTVNRTRARVGDEVSKEELDNQLELDAVDEYATLFDDAVVDSSEDTVVLPGSWVACKNAPNSFIADLPDKSLEEDDDDLTANEWGKSFQEVSRSKSMAVVSKSNAPIKYITAGRDLTSKDTEVVENVEKNGGSFVTDSCVPCKKWEFPGVGQPGFFHACKRLLAVDTEITPPDDWPYQDAWTEDPLIKISQRPPLPVRENVKGSLAIQLFDKYVFPEIYGESKNHGSFIVQTMKTELLRCYPVSMGPENPNLNSLLQFVCWWHKNITVEPTGPGGVRSVNDESIEAEKCYQALCMPNLTPTIKTPKGHGSIEQTEYKWIENKRKSVHRRVRTVMNFMYKNLKLALDKDVLTGKREDSIILQGGGSFVDMHKRNLDIAKSELIDAEAEHAAAPPEDPQNSSAIRKQIKQLNTNLDKKKKAVTDAKEMLVKGTPTAEDKRLGRILYDEWKSMNPPKVQ